MLSRLSADIPLLISSIQSHSQHRVVSSISCIRSPLVLNHSRLSRITLRLNPSSTLITMVQPQGKSIAVDHAIQKAYESHSEAVIREQADFPKVENSLDIERFSLSELGIVDKATGVLGSLNPFGKDAHADEHEVWLLDNTAYQKRSRNVKDGLWEAEFVACFFQKGRKDITKYITHLADQIGLDGKAGLDPAVQKIMTARIQPFVSAIAPARIIKVVVPEKQPAPRTLTLGPSNSNGISSQIINIGHDESADGTTITYTNDGPEFPKCSGKTRFAKPDGWAIISDIDDTIKVTQTSDPIGILRNTFTEEPKTTEGMENFYKILDLHFQKPAWFYLSASPYNLYPFLHEFIHQFYPAGTIILRDASWMFFGGLLQSLTQGVQEYKTDRMKKIHEWIPQRKMICIGDSTQKDPESYAEIYHKYPGWIKAIYIRKVTDIPFMEMRNRDERFEKAFKHVPAHVWKLFETPDEIAEHIKNLTGDADMA